MVHTALDKRINPFTSCEFFTTSLDLSISNSCVSRYFLVLQYYILYYIEIPVFKANSVEPSQIPYSAVSDQGLHCLPITPLRVSRLKWFKRILFFYFST